MLLQPTDPSGQRSKNMRKVGRPTIPDQETLKNRSVKVTDADWERIKDLAEQAGLTASEYMRVCALAGPVYMDAQTTKEVERLLAELTKIFKA